MKVCRHALGSGKVVVGALLISPRGPCARSSNGRRLGSPERDSETNQKRCQGEYFLLELS